MRIVFMGTPEFAVPSLEMLYDNAYEVVGAVTQPDRPNGRGGRLTPSPVKRTALSRGTAVYQPEKIRRDGLAYLRNAAPDLVVTAAFGQILSQDLLDVPRLGTVNVHASLLPKHRGPAPIAWGIIGGDSLFGVTTMMTDRGIDTGDILMQRETCLQEMETCGELTRRLSLMGAELLRETLVRLGRGDLRRVRQNEADHTYEPMLSKRMREIDWGKPSADIVRLIHGLNPWPGARTGGLKLLNARITKTGGGQPGEVLTADAAKGLVIGAGEGAVEIVRLQAPGGKPMDAGVYLLGHPMQAGGLIHAATE